MEKIEANVSETDLFWIHDNGVFASNVRIGLVDDFGKALGHDE